MIKRKTITSRIRSFCCRVDDDVDDDDEDDDDEYADKEKMMRCSEG